MGNKSYFYVPLAKRVDFNASVRHIQSVLEVLDCKPSENIADIMNELLVEKEIESDQVLPIVSVALIDRWKYQVTSVNLEEVCKDPKKVISAVEKWKGVDIILGYHHPDLGYLAINPKNPASQSIIEGFRKNELLQIFVGQQDAKEIDEKLAKAVISAMLNLLYNKTATVPASAKTGNFVFKASKPKATPKPATRKKTGPARKAPSRKAPPTAKRPAYAAGSTPSAGYEVPDYLRRDVPSTPVGRKNMSQLVSVVVSNELFHNGNVEAWKRIVRSYNAKYPEAEVIIYYDGERIVDINTLFKWGKVKHGSTIQFAVAADNIKDLSKLRKYFTQGASPRFEDFLKGSPDTVLNLF